MFINQIRHTIFTDPTDIILFETISGIIPVTTILHMCIPWNIKLFKNVYSVSTNYAFFHVYILWCTTKSL